MIARRAIHRASCAIASSCQVLRGASSPSASLPSAFSSRSGGGRARFFSTPYPVQQSDPKTRPLGAAILHPTASATKGDMASAASATVSNDPLVWIDCEMTGLDPETDEILEIYCLITDGNLALLDNEGFHAVLHCPKSRLDQMDDWCTATHRSTGLTAACIASTTTAQQAADALYAYVTRLVPESRRALLAGSSVHVDRQFLGRGAFGRVVEHLHYRILDVSSIKEAARRWSPVAVVEGLPRKVGSHKARDDILDSIEEARYYRDSLFRG